MKSGKVSDTVLGRSVLLEVKKVNQSVPCPRVGGGAAVVPGKRIASAMQTVVGEGTDTAYLAAVRAANSLAAKAAKPRYASVAITIPKAMEERELRKMQERAGQYFLEGGVEILGGHTAVSRNVEAPVATVQMYGELSEAAGLDASSFLGMDVVMTKYCGLGGTALLAGHYREELEERYQKRFIKRAAQLLSEIQKNGECQIALESGAVYAHAAAEGGVFGALWELAEYAQCGLKIDLRRIPILQETVEICEVFDLNPYQLRTEGVFLFLTEHGERLCEKLSEAGICAAVIGKTVAGLDRAVHNEEEVRYLEPNRVEEYERIRSLREASGVE